MDIMDPDDNQYIQLAISTVFYLNRDRINIQLDASSSDRFIKDMSLEIITRAQKFKLLTANLGDLH